MNDQDFADLMDDKTATNVLHQIRASGGIPKSKPPATKVNNTGYAKRGTVGQRQTRSNKESPITSKNASPARSVPMGIPTGSKDSDLLTSMAAKLRQLEAHATASRKAIADRDHEIEMLKNELDILKACEDTGASTMVRDLQTENATLKKQVEEMERFLSGYGLKWKEQQGSFDFQRLKGDIGSQAVFNHNLPGQLDLRVVAHKIQELNNKLNNTRIMNSQGNVHQMNEVDEIPIFFFKNGIILYGHQFKAYSSNDAQSWLSDLLEGYFPYDLKRKYPDGAPLKVVDRSDEDYVPGDRGMGSLGNRDLGIMSRDQFLDQLPASVMKNGEIIPIREAIGQKLGAAPEVAPGTLTGDIEIPTDVDPTSTTRKFTSLRIKTENGTRNLLIKMWYDSKFSDLRAHIERYKESSGAVEVRSTFPMRTFALDCTETFQELGLTPNYALALKSI